MKQAGHSCALGRMVNIAFFFAAIAEPAQAADTLSKIRDTQTITIAYREASVPFSYINGDKPIGYAVDLCLKIAEAVRRELKLTQLNVSYVPVTSSTRVAAIAGGNADLECGSTTNNAERRKQVAFTIPHFVATTRMLVRSDAQINNWSDLRDKKVVATKGTTTVKLLEGRDKIRSMNLKLLEGNDHTDSFHLVENGEVDAFATDDVLLFGLRAQAKDPQRFTVAGDALSVEPYAIMLRKDDAPFKSIVDREMVRIIYDGEIYKIYDKWFQRPIPPANLNMNMAMGHLLRDLLRYPTDKVGD